ncbi:tetratricopeptide repeat protein [[Eubacterium] cellulosolvens]
MPDYCRSCHYNKFCKNAYVSNPTCPMGYSPVGREPKKGTLQKDMITTSQVYKPEILLKIGKTAINKNDYNTAIECYQKLLEVKPNDPEANFLLRRAKYMAEGKDTESLAKSKKKEVATEAEEEGDEKPAPKGSAILPIQQFKRISIRPEQHYEVNRDLIGPGSEKVYGVEEDEDEKEMEKVSRTVAIRSKRSVLKEKGTLVAVALAITIIIMIVIGLWAFGFLNF